MEHFVECLLENSVFPTRTPKISNNCKKKKNWFLTFSLHNIRTGGKQLLASKEEQPGGARRREGRRRGWRQRRKEKKKRNKRGWRQKKMKFLYLKNNLRSQSNTYSNKKWKKNLYKCYLKNIKIKINFSKN